MANFNLADYETVEERLERYWKEHPNGKILTFRLPSPDNQYIFKAEIYRNADDSFPWATGHAEETISQSGVNKTSACENSESSSIGRALANAGYAKRGKRPSQSEMGKVVRLSTETIKVEKPDDPWSVVEKPMPSSSDEIIQAVQQSFATDEEIPYCNHGQMHLKEGDKNGRPQHGYICSYSGTNKSDQCPAIWYQIDKQTGRWAKPKAVK